MAYPNLGPKTKKPPAQPAATLEIGQPKRPPPAISPKAPALVGQSSPPPQNAGNVDPVTGARTPVNGAPPPPPPPTTPPVTVERPDLNTGGSLTGAVADRGNAAAGREVTDVSTDALDQQLRALIAKRIGAAGNVDTSADEGVINDLMQRQLGEQLVGQRASMGRGGFSGIAAMEGDLQRQAALEAQREILGLRRVEDQRAFDNALTAAGTDLDFRRFGSEDEIARAKLKALQEYLGLTAEGADVGGDIGADFAQGALDLGNDAIFGGGVETETQALPSSGGADAGSMANGSDPANAIPVSSPPPGAARNAAASEQAGADVYYDPSARKWYVVGG